MEELVLAQKQSSETWPQQCKKWLVLRLGTLQVAFPGTERIPDERNEIYFRVLLPIIEVMAPDQAEQGFQRCIRECRRYPSIAEMLEKFGVDERIQNELGGHDAWEKVQKSLRKWGVDRLPLYQRGKSIYPPPFDERTEHAIRAVGGLHRINSATDHDFGFIQRDFLAAWEQYEKLRDFQTHHSLTAGALPSVDRQLSSRVIQLSSLKSMDGPDNQSVPKKLPNRAVASTSGAGSVSSCDGGKY